MNYLIIGSGRTAKNWQHYLQLLNIPVNSWNRKQPHADLKTLIGKSSHILLLISDSAIESFYKEHTILAEKTCIHFSGALEIPWVHSVHPLASFTDKLLDLNSYKNITLVSTSEKTATELIPGLGNPFHKIKSSDKARYHALCVMGGNFSVLLWQKVSAEFAKLGLPPEAEKPYRQMIFNNIQSDLQNSLTGPISRKDDITIFKNLDSLSGDKYQKIYLAFLKAHYPKAAEEYIESRAGGIQ